MGKMKNKIIAATLGIGMTFGAMTGLTGCSNNVDPEPDEQPKPITTLGWVISKDGIDENQSFYYDADGHLMRRTTFKNGLDFGYGNTNYDELVGLPYTAGMEQMEKNTSVYRFTSKTYEVSYYLKGDGTQKNYSESTGEVSNYTPKDGITRKWNEETNQIEITYDTRDFMSRKEKSATTGIGSYPLLEQEITETISETHNGNQLPSNSSRKTLDYTTYDTPATTPSNTGTPTVNFVTPTQPATTTNNITSQKIYYDCTNGELKHSYSYENRTTKTETVTPNFKFGMYPILNGLGYGFGTEDFQTYYFNLNGGQVNFDGTALSAYTSSDGVTRTLNTTDGTVNIAITDKTKVRSALSRSTINNTDYTLGR